MSSTYKVLFLFTPLYYSSIYRVTGMSSALIPVTINKAKRIHFSILCCVSYNGEPSYILRHFLEKDLSVPYERLVDLGMEYRDGKVYLKDLGDLKSDDPP